MGDPLGSKVRVGGAQLPWVVMVAASRCLSPSLTAGVRGQQAVEQVVKVHGAHSSGECADHRQPAALWLVDCVDQSDSLKLYTIC
ncbi:hypothetical protein FRT60_14765 [Pseudomonas haemolytica]|uniref:Uncharacterized protein n=1 Tax=Pseudomonas haemolytica TaxID=2600065 RepID=A0A646NZM3_9PSED|nr:hypothetical protein [Pseudomonas haemolytica]